MPTPLVNLRRDRTPTTSTTETTDGMRAVGPTLSLTSRWFADVGARVRVACRGVSSSYPTRENLVAIPTVTPVCMVKQYVISAHR